MDGPLRYFKFWILNFKLKKAETNLSSIQPDTQCEFANWNHCSCHFRFDCSLIIFRDITELITQSQIQVKADTAIIIPLKSPDKAKNAYCSFRCFLITIAD